MDAISTLKPRFALLGFVLLWLLDVLELHSKFRESMGVFFSFFKIMKQSERMESDLIKPTSNFFSAGEAVLSLRRAGLL